jgi:cytoskeletal protein RodZ
LLGITIAYKLINLVLQNIHGYKHVNNQKNNLDIFLGVSNMMESPGKFLRKERETRNISLEEISKFTKIKQHYLKAIEEDRYELLPAVPYVKGFLNGYARYLTLNPKDIVLQYENYLKSLIPSESIELQHQAQPKKKSLRAWFFTLLLP